MLSLSQRKLLPLGLYLPIVLQRAHYGSLEGASLPYCLCVKLSKCCGVDGVLPLGTRNDSSKWLSRH